MTDITSTRCHSTAVAADTVRRCLCTRPLCISTITLFETETRSQRNGSWINTASGTSGVLVSASPSSREPDRALTCPAQCLQKFQLDTTGCSRLSIRFSINEDTATVQSVARTNDYDDYDQHTRSEREWAYCSWVLFILQHPFGWTCFFRTGLVDLVGSLDRDEARREVYKSRFLKFNVSTIAQSGSRVSESGHDSRLLRQPLFVRGRWISTFG